MISTIVMGMLLLQSPVPDPVIQQIGIDQKLGDSIDLNLGFRDEAGTEVRLKDFFGTNPVILTPIYYSCPMLCSLQLNGLVRAMRVLPFTPGNEFEIVTFSFNPNEKPELALAKKEHYIRDFGKPAAAAGWHFLTGSPDVIQKLTQQIGFRYVYNSDTGEWSHANGIMVLTPDGRLSQYWNGIEYDSGDLRLSLIEASNGKIGSIVDRVLLYCYQYDPKSGKYSLMIMRVIQLCGIATVLALGVFIVFAKPLRHLRTRVPSQ